MKRQTIRKVRKNPIKEGETLHFYAGMRTVFRRKLGTAVCSKIEPIEIYTKPNSDTVVIYLSGKLLGPAHSTVLANLDGFYDEKKPLRHFGKWFNAHYGNTFKGVIIHWDDFKAR